MADVRTYEITLKGSKGDEGRWNCSATATYVGMDGTQHSKLQQGMASFASILAQMGAEDGNTPTPSTP